MSDLKSFSTATDGGPSSVLVDTLTVRDNEWLTYADAAVFKTYLHPTPNMAQIVIKGNSKGVCVHKRRRHMNQDEVLGRNGSQTLESPFSIE